MNELVTSWLGEHFVRSLRASHLRVDFTSLYETKKGCTGKPLLGGFCLTGLVGQVLLGELQPEPAIGPRY